MSASLVGSEMCIRDSPSSPPPGDQGPLDLLKAGETETETEIETEIQTETDGSSCVGSRWDQPARTAHHF
eukprot:14156713-Alexandrium_andersonii.AAC.1